MRRSRLAGLKRKYDRVNNETLAMLYAGGAPEIKLRDKLNELRSIRAKIKRMRK